MVDVCVLGTVEIRAAGRAFALPRGGERCVLATLAFSPGRRVHVDVLVGHVWGDEPPANAEQTIASYVRAVRRAVEQAGGRREWLRNHRPGAYQLDIAPDLVDYHRFQALVAGGVPVAEAVPEEGRLERLFMEPAAPRAGEGPA